MSDFQSAKASLLFCRSFAAHGKGGRNLGPGCAKPHAVEQGAEAGLALAALRDAGGLHQALRLEGNASREEGGHLSCRGWRRSCEPLTAGSLGMPDKESGSEGAASGTGGPEQHVLEKEDNNNFPLIGGGPAGEELPKRGSSAPVLQNSPDLAHGGCVQKTGVGGDSALDLKDKPPKPPVGSLEVGPAHWPDCDGQSHRSGPESLAENVIKLDPAKGKSANLKDRILQFPLCEKAFAFHMQPSSKESLLSLGQFNCCHVI